MAFMDAFTPQAQESLRRSLDDPELLIEVETDDALNFACNAVEIGESIIMNSASHRLRDRLAHAGLPRIFN